MRATLVRSLGATPKGADQILWHLDEPLEDYDHVITSAWSAPDGPETYVFGSDETGEILDYGELHGSFRGALDHYAALERAGYETTP